MTDSLKIHCNKCLCLTRHQQRSAFEEVLSDDETINWQIVQCNGCESISFYKEHLVEGENGLWEIDESYAYPSRQYRLPKQFINAPERLEQLYKDTIEAFNIGTLLFCAGGLRALVEGICSAQNVTDGPKFDLSQGKFQTKKDSDVVARGKDLQCRIV